MLNSPQSLIQIIKCYSFWFYHSSEARAKNIQNFVGFLEYGRTWYFAFEIYWPLSSVAWDFDLDAFYFCSLNIIQNQSL